MRLPADHLVHPARHTARYRRPGGPGTWYASSSEAAAWAELMRHAPTLSAADLMPRRVCTVRVRAMRAVDLVDAVTLALLGLSADALVSDEPADLAALAEVGAWAYAAGFDGILAPSAALVAARTLVVFPSGMRAVAIVDQRLADPPTWTPRK